MCTAQSGLLAHGLALIHLYNYIVGSSFEELAGKVVESFETSLHGPLRANEAIELITTLGLFSVHRRTIL